MTVNITHTDYTMTTVMIRQVAEAALGPPEAVGIRPMRPEDRDCLVQMLRRCSRASLYHRFHGFSDGSAYVYRQLRTEPDIVRVAWAGPTCIGFGVLAENGSRPWDLGILVEDTWQLHGVGTRLLLGLIGEAKRSQMSVVEAAILSEDAFIVRLLRRVGPIRSEIDRETLTLEVSLADARP
jgi:GNAT superfamily N-acetyltransferase